MGEFRVGPRQKVGLESMLRNLPMRDVSDVHPRRTMSMGSLP